MTDEIDNSNMIYIGVPRERIYITDFIDNRDMIIHELQKKHLAAGLFSAEGHRVDRNRDRIVEQFLVNRHKPPWLLMLDTDMQHPIECPTRLSAWDVPIVGALYFHRSTHDPLAFREAEGYDDKYGRFVKRWEPVRDEVFQFLIDHNVPMKDEALSIDNCLYSSLLEVDAVGTGCILIHRDVLETMEPPWFEYRPLGNSEDLVFCYEAKHDYHFPIHVDMSQLCGHYHWVAMGQAQFRNLYIGRGVSTVRCKGKDAVVLLEEFLGMTAEEASKRYKGGSSHMVGDYWKQVFEDSPPDIEGEHAFYKDDTVGSLYIIELLHWNATELFQKLQSILTVFRKMKILEFGGGIGTVAMQLAIQKNDVVSMEVNTLLREFSEYRWDRIKDGIKTEVNDIEFVDDSYEPKPESFDVVVAFDFFEHLTEKLLDEYLSKANKALKIGGKLLYHNNFRQQEIYPMHHDYSAEWDTLLSEHGFVRTTDIEAVKVT